MNLRPHRNLEVWKLSMDFTKSIYQATKSFPASETYGLAAQMKRAAVSIPSNLAEGAARKGAKEFRQFLNVAQGSLSELDTQIELAAMLGFLTREQGDELVEIANKISRMLYGLSRKLT